MQNKGYAALWLSFAALRCAAMASEPPRTTRPRVPAEAWPRLTPWRRNTAPRWRCACHTPGASPPSTATAGGSRRTMRGGRRNRQPGNRSGPPRGPQPRIASPEIQATRHPKHTEPTHIATCTPLCGNHTAAVRERRKRRWTRLSNTPPPTGNNEHVRTTPSRRRVIPDMDPLSVMPFRRRPVKCPLRRWRFSCFA